MGRRLIKELESGDSGAVDGTVRAKAFTGGTTADSLSGTTFIFGYHARTPTFGGGQKRTELGQSGGTGSPNNGLIRRSVTGIIVAPRRAVKETRRRVEGRRAEARHSVVRTSEQACTCQARASKRGGGIHA